MKHSIHRPFLGPLRQASLLLALFLVGCQESAPSSQAGNNADGLVDNRRELRTGLYEVVGREAIAGVVTGEERREQLCIGPTHAAHPDRFLVNPGNGCTPGELIQSDGEMRREFRCNDDRVLNFTVTFTSDSWDRSIIGTSYQGSYEATERGRRIGDC